MWRYASSTRFWKQQTRQLGLHYRACISTKLRLWGRVKRKAHWDHWRWDRLSRRLSPRPRVRLPWNCRLLTTRWWLHTNWGFITSDYVAHKIRIPCVKLVAMWPLSSSSKKRFKDSPSNATKIIYNTATLDTIIWAQNNGSSGRKLMQNNICSHKKG